MGRKKIIKKIVIIDGKPVETEQVIDESGEKIKEDVAENYSSEVLNVDTDNDSSVHKVIKRKIIKKIVIVDGNPVEISVSEKLDTAYTDEPEQAEILQTHRIIRKKIIKKIVVIDGKPVEIEEVINEPLTTEELEPQESLTEETTHTYRIIKKRIIRKILIVDGKPVEVEEFEEDPISDGPEFQNLITEEETRKMENERENDKSGLTGVDKTVDTPLEVQVKTKDMSENIPDDKMSSKQTSFNLPIPEHANDWMDVIESRGFSLDDEDEQLADNTENNPKNENGSVYENKKENEKQKPALFNLPIPDHANDWMDVIEGGGFTLDDEDEEEDNDNPTKGDTGETEKTDNISDNILEKQGMNTPQKEAPS